MNNGHGQASRRLTRHGDQGDEAAQAGGLVTGPSYCCVLLTGICDLTLADFVNFVSKTAKI